MCFKFAVGLKLRLVLCYIVGCKYLAPQINSLYIKHIYCSASARVCSCFVLLVPHC